MIGRVKITDRNNLPFRYAARLDAFSDGKEYVFRPGVNVIVGNNGCGKTTLVRMLATFLFCEHPSLWSELERLSHTPNLCSYGFTWKGKTLQEVEREMDLHDARQEAERWQLLLFEKD